MKDTHIQKFESVYTTSDCYYGTELRKEFTDFFDDKPLAGLSALDLGCGEGRYALYLSQKGCHVLAIDRSTAGISKLRSRADAAGLPVTARVEDIEGVVFGDHRFDLIVAATVLDHLPEALRLQTIDNIKAALKPGGLAYINVFTESDPGFALNASPPDVSSRDPGKNDVSETAVCLEYYFKAGELRSLFKEFEILFYYEVTEPDLSHGNPHHHGWACMLARKTQR